MYEEREGRAHLGLGRTGLTRLEFALLALVDGGEGPTVTQVACPDDEGGV